MTNLKLQAIRFLDAIDHNILRHRFEWLCDRLGNSAWWGPEVWVTPDELNDLEEAFGRDGRLPWRLRFNYRIDNGVSRES